MHNYKREMRPTEEIGKQKKLNKSMLSQLESDQFNGGELAEERLKAISCQSASEGKLKNQPSIGGDLSKELKLKRKIILEQVNRSSITTSNTATVMKISRGTDWRGFNPIALCVCLAVILTTPSALNEVS